jgi:hypothetical protein
MNSTLLGRQPFEFGSQVNTVIMEAENVSETQKFSTLTADSGQRFGPIYILLFEL